MEPKTSKLVFAQCFHSDSARTQELTNYFQNDTESHSSRHVTLETLRNGTCAVEIRETPSLLAGHLLTIPLICNSDVLGFITLGNDKHYSTEDILLAEEVTRRAALALHNARLYQKVCLSEAELFASKKVAEEANQAKSQFLANLSHEIRTPIGVILGFSDLLVSGNGSEDQRSDWGRRIQQNGQQLLRLIDDILNLTKIERGQINLEVKKVNFSFLYDELKKAFAPLAASKNLELRFLLKTSIPSYFFTDSDRLMQILNNVISNAIKFTDTGVVTISAGFQKESGFLYFDIEDTGPGLTRHEAAKLFQPFSQADTAHARRSGGSGLGLALSANLARLLGGNLELVSSEPGMGAIFRVMLMPDLHENTEFIQ